mmetsp:Transcript_13466/g.27513  ORF Transcript_13466/g.27513 Transcript_13466/m.27513 type:complete len:253 (-) Transcript_13466:1193-1951(-)
MKRRTCLDRRGTRLRCRSWNARSGIRQSTRWCGMRRPKPWAPLRTERVWRCCGNLSRILRERSQRRASWLFRPLMSACRSMARQVESARTFTPRWIPLKAGTMAELQKSLAVVSSIRTDRCLNATRPCLRCGTEAGRKPCSSCPGVWTGPWSQALYSATRLPTSLAKCKPRKAATRSNGLCVTRARMKWFDMRPPRLLARFQPTGAVHSSTNFSSTPPMWFAKAARSRSTLSTTTPPTFSSTPRTSRSSTPK